MYEMRGEAVLRCVVAWSQAPLGDRLGVHQGGHTRSLQRMPLASPQCRRLFLELLGDRVEFGLRQPGSGGGDLEVVVLVEADDDARDLLDIGRAALTDVDHVHGFTSSAARTDIGHMMRCLMISR